MKTVAIALVALATVASSSTAFAGSSPFCFGGSPTPKWICDVIKANQKPKPSSVYAAGILGTQVGDPHNPPSALGQPLRTAPTSSLK